VTPRADRAGSSTTRPGVSCDSRRCWHACSRSGSSPEAWVSPTCLLADCSTKIIYQQESSEAPHTAEVLGLSVTERGELPDLQRGEGLWRVGQRAFVVRHLVTDGELQLFDTNSRMLAAWEFVS